ncbi:MAG: TonB-dependent receptor [Gammaproteobacteria bacterium]|nr:hypothetical protein [Gammaproteobacteria bacterium]
MKDKAALRTLKLCSLAAALVCTVESRAQAPSRGAAGGLEEVVVTARYREERLQDTPIAISAVTAEDIQVRAFSSSFEVGYMIPNASLRPAQAAFGNTMTAFIRGIGQNDFDFAFEPGVGIYIDDIYHPFTLGSQIELLDLARVEVLRGPQGTLFGRGSIGGAIRYVTQPPQGDGSGNIRLTAGTFDRIDVRASYDFAVTDNLFARVAGVARSRDGYQDVIDFACAFPELAGPLQPQTVNRGADCRIGTQGGENVVGLRGALRWVASESFEMTVTAEHVDDSSEARADTLLVVDTRPEAWPSLVPGLPYDERFLPPDPYVSYATYADPLTGLRVTPQTGMDKEMISVRADWDITDAFGLAAIVAYTDMTATLATDADGSPINMQTVDGIQETDYVTAELRFNGRAFERMEWTAGLFYYDGDSINQQMVSIPFLSLILDGVPPDQNATRPFVNARNVHQNRNESVYAHIVYDFNERLSINGGVRYSDDEKNVNFDNTRVQNPNVVVADDHFDWRIGLDYRFSDALMAYVSAATGYRPGSYNPRPFQATQVVAVENEESTAYEIGVKSDLLDRRLRLNAALFYTDWETRILTDPGTECTLLDLGPPPVYDTVPPGTPGSVTDSLGNTCLAGTTVSRTFYVNGPGTIRGAEIELQYSPAERWTIGAVYGLTDWDSQDINDDPNVLSDRPIYVPEDNWALSVAYSASTRNGAAWTPRVDLYGQSEICTSLPRADAAFPDAGCSAGYELWNARVEWASPDGEWLVAIGATNVRDKQYFLNRFDLTAFGQPHAEGQPGPPREWYLTLQRDF